MPARTRALELSLKGAADRIEKVTKAQDNRRKINSIVTVTGFNTQTGLYVGKRPDGSKVEFQLATTASVRIGQEIEVAIARGSTLGRGDARPRR